MSSVAGRPQLIARRAAGSQSCVPALGGERRAKADGVGVLAFVDDTLDEASECE